MILADSEHSAPYPFFLSLGWALRGFRLGIGSLKFQATALGGSAILHGFCPCSTEVVTSVSHRLCPTTTIFEGPPLLVKKKL